MNDTDARGMFEKIKALILKPKEVWPSIATEDATPGDLMVRYAVPLAAIGPVASFIHGQLFGYGAFGFSYKPGLMGGLSTAVISYVMGLVGVIVFALIAEFLAPKFGGEANRRNAFKLVVFGSTAGWIAGIFGLIPGLGFLGLLGLYSIYLFYTGATPVMKVPEDKAVGFTVVSIIAAAVLYIVVGALSSAVVGMFGGAAMMASSDEGGEVTLPGGGTLDTSKIEAATKQIEDAANGKKVAVAPTELQSLLPASVGAYQRTAIESTALGGMGSQAEATYTAGDKSFKLKVSDLGGVGAIAGIGAAMGVEQSREDANGYERTTSVDGQMQTESWNISDTSGKFGRMVATRFMVEAEGQANSIDELKAAVATINADRLEGMGK